MPAVLSRLRLLLPAFLAFLSLLPPAVHARAHARHQDAAAPVVYTVSRVDAASRTVRVTCEAPLAGEVTFSLPYWVPGNYEPVPLRRSVANVRLHLNGGQEVPLREDSGHGSWSARIPEGAHATLTYTVRAAEGAGSRGLSHLYVGGDTAFMLPVACLVYLPGSEARPCELRLELPAGWTALAPLEKTEGGFRARDYEQLGDSPVEMGRLAPGSLAVASLEAAHRPLRIITNGPAAAHVETLEEVGRMALEAGATLFGDTPFPEYAMGLHAGSGGEEGITGLEHARAATMAFGGWYPLDDRNVRGRGASLIFHEVFHAWNVKTLRPAEFTPYHLERAPRCRTLWFAEGFTDYYGSLLPRRAGLWKTSTYFYEEVARAYARYAGSPGRRKTSLMRASEISFHNPVYGEGDGTSYYVKGMLAGLLLDLDIRSRTGGRKSLDDVMRWLYRRYGPGHPGYPDDFLTGAIQAATGVDLAPECHSYLETADDLPLRDRLARFALRLERDGDDWRITEDPAAPESARRLRDAWLAPDGPRTGGASAGDRLLAFEFAH
jgi:predicted metalloprotease with PDZ domain